MECWLLRIFFIYRETFILHYAKRTPGKHLYCTIQNIRALLLVMLTEWKNKDLIWKSTLHPLLQEMNEKDLRRKRLNKREDGTKMRQNKQRERNMIIKYLNLNY